MGPVNERELNLVLKAVLRQRDLSEPVNEGYVLSVEQQTIFDMTHAVAFINGECQMVF